MKGVQYFLDAAIVLAGRFPDVRFLVVGDGESKKELEEHACRLGLGQRIVFTGFRSDVPDLLSEAAISVLPSLSEGASNTLLESGVSGLLVPPRDSAAIAAATARLLEDEDLALRLGQAGMRRVSELFSLDGSVHETERLYQRLVEAKSHV